MGNNFASASVTYKSNQNQPCSGESSFSLFHKSIVQAADIKQEDDDDDPLERMLKKTGCMEKHYSVQMGGFPNPATTYKEKYFLSKTEDRQWQAVCPRPVYGECIAETKDWRQCQKQVQDFKECMEKYKKDLS